MNDRIFANEVIYAKWWIPGKEETSAIGRLSLRDGDIFVEFCELADPETDPGPFVSEIEVLWGEDAAGKRYSLMNLTKTSNIFRNYRTRHYRMCIIGAHIHDINGIHASSISFRIDALRDWAGFFSDTDKKTSKVLISSVIFSDAEVSIQKLNRFEMGISKFIETTSVYGFIDLDSVVNFSRMQYYMQVVQRFLSFVFNCPISLIDVSFINLSDEITIYNNSITSDSDSKQAPLFIGLIEHEISCLMSEWASLYDKYSSSISLHYLVMTNPDLIIEQKFLLIIQGIEAFHRAKNPPNDREVTEWISRIRRIRQMAKADPDLASILDKCFYNYGYEPGLKQRIRELAQKANCVVNIGGPGQIKDFTCRVYDTRNFLTHHPLGAFSPLSPNEYILALHKLVGVFEYSIMQEMGMTETRILEVFSERYKGWIPFQETWPGTECI